jgi:hypothetical protein
MLLFCLSDENYRNVRRAQCCLYVQKFAYFADRFVCCGLGRGRVKCQRLGCLGFVAGDTFILDKMLKGWRPNRFIEGPLKDFISSE